MTNYLALDDVLAIHEDQVMRFGGQLGLRDPELLEAALYRPQTGYYTDVLEEAAALWESLSQNHPFIDGNKRVAFAAVDTFLKINGKKITFDPLATYDWIMSLHERGEFDFAHILVWLRQNAA